MNPQRLFLLYIHKLLTDSLDFEAVARDFASTSNKLFCYSSQSHADYFIYREHTKCKKFASGGTRERITPSRIHPLRRKERVHSFFLPPHIKNLLTALTGSPFS